MSVIVALFVAWQLICQATVCLPELQQDKQYLPFVSGATRSVADAPAPIEVNHE